MESHLLTLDRGLRAVSIPVPSFHSVELILYLRMGSRFENLQNNGISHFLEHLLFRGCEQYPTQIALSKAFDKIGCVLNGFTAKDHMGFSVQIPMSELNEALKILSALFEKPLLNDLDVEREIILEEMLEDRDENGRNIDIENISRSLIFHETHNISLPVIGKEENIKKISKDGLILHHKRAFSGKNIIIAASGNLDSNSFFDNVNSSFLWVENGKLDEFPFAPRPPSGPKMIAQKYNSSKVDLFMSFYGLKETDPDMFTLIILKRLLDYGMGSRLYSKICSNLGLAYDIEVRIESYIDGGLLDIIASASQGKVVQLVKTIQEEITNLLAFGIGDDEFLYAKKRYVYDIEFSKDNLSFLTYWYGCNNLYYSPHDLDKLKEIVSYIKKDDVINLAKRIFRKDNCYLTLVGNVESEREWDFCILE